MRPRVKFSYKSPRPPSQSGQALLEYVLILVVSVSLVLALMTQIFQPLQKFLTSYMGDYTACLLETGELPTLGSDDTTAADEGCSAKFEAASLTAGRPAKGGASTAPAAKSSSNKDDAGAGAGAGTASRDHSSGRFSSGARRGTQSGDSNGEKGKSTEIPTDSAGNGFFKSNNVDRIAARSAKTMAVGIAGLSEAEKKKLAKKESLATRIIATDGPGAPLKKIAVKPPPPKETVEAADQPFTIGNFMRMLFIIAIILAIVVFVGGQVLQMSKSFEK